MLITYPSGVGVVRRDRPFDDARQDRAPVETGERVRQFVRPGKIESEPVAVDVGGRARWLVSVAVAACTPTWQPVSSNRTVSAASAVIVHAFLSVVPVLVLFLFLQRQFVAGAKNPREKLDA